MLTIPGEVPDMPAYAVKMESRPCETKKTKCLRTAVYQVYNGLGALVGYFCEPHAESEVEDLNIRARSVDA